ncbi:MAG: HEAT repeat domain-containing protein [Gammaproteobacteria bacterium]|nr:HEAT repeat domain-containing protein [Gammaproteobacteria bacterium]
MDRIGVNCLLLGFMALTGACGKDDRHGAGYAGVSSQVPPACLDVRATGPFLSVRSCGVAVGVVLEEIARQRGLVVRSHHPLDDRISVDFEGQSLADTVARILQNHGYILRSGFPAQADTLWVLESGAEAGPGVVENASQPHAALTSPDAKIRLKAIFAMTVSDDGQAQMVLADLALNDPSLAVREEAIHAVAEIGGTFAMPVLQQALFDPAPRIRAAAVDALADSAGDEVATVLAFALQDENAAIRLSAVDALGEIGGAAEASFLHQALADEYSVVREAAAAWLVELSTRK